MTNQTLTLEDVFNQLVLEEAAPNKATMVKWQRRYPQYSRELADFCFTWAVQKLRAKAPNQVVVDEDKIAVKGVALALETMRQQGRIVEKSPVESLGPFDELVLTAVYLLHGAGDVAGITEKVDEMSGRHNLMGSIYVSLSRLERKRLLDSRLVGEEDEQFFAVTLDGERVLADAKEKSKVIADFLGDFA
jgi:hypothetical protein